MATGQRRTLPSGRLWLGPGDPTPALATPRHRPRNKALRLGSIQHVEVVQLLLFRGRPLVKGDPLASGRYRR